MADQIEWFEVSPSGWETEAALWARTLGVRADGSFLIPVGVFANELEAFYFLAYDGRPAVICEGHIYIDPDVAETMWPEETELIMAMRLMAAEAKAGKIGHA